MAFAASGSYLTVDSSLFNFSPNNVGDLVLIEVVSLSNTSYCSSVSGGNCTWTQIGNPFLGSNTAYYANVFAGKVIATGSAPISLAFTGGVPTIRGGLQEFTSTVGSWALDAQGSVDSATANSPTLTPAAAGELYFSYIWDSGSAVAGSTANYTYDIDVHANGLLFNPNCTSAAQTPVWGDSSARIGLAVLVKESPISVIQSVAVNSSSGFSGNFPTNVTPGNSIVMVTTGHNPGTTLYFNNPQYNGGTVGGTVNLISDQTITVVNGGGEGSAYASIWLLPNVQTSGTSFSISNNSDGGGFVGIIAYEVSGLGPNPVMDQYSSANGSASFGSTFPTGMTGNITAANELIVGCIVQDNTNGGLPDSPWTNLTLPFDENSYAAYQIATSSGGNYQYEDSSNGQANWTSVIVTIMPSPSNIKVVQAQGFINSSSGSLHGNVQNGNTVFLAMSAYSNSGATISTSAPTLGGSTPAGSVKLMEQQNISGGFTAYTAIWMMPNCPGGSVAVSLSLTNGTLSGNVGLIAFEVSGLGLSPVLDKSSSNNGNNMALDSGNSGAISSANEFILGSLSQASTVNFIPNGFACIPLGASDGIAGYQIATVSGGVYDFATGLDVNGQWASGVVTVKAGITSSNLLMASLP